MSVFLENVIQGSGTLFGKEFMYAWYIFRNSEGACILTRFIALKLSFVLLLKFEIKFFEGFLEIVFYENIVCLQSFSDRVIHYLFLKTIVVNFEKFLRLIIVAI